MRNITRWVLTGWFVLAPAFAYAQDWAAVQQLPLGSRLRIELPKEVFEERLSGVDEKQITMHGRAIDRDDIQRIDRIRGQRQKGAAVGILTGLGVGMVQSLATASSNKVGFGLWLGVRYAVIGGLIGAAISSPRVEPVYQRPQAAPRQRP